MLYTPAPALLHILDPGFRNTLSTRIVASTPVSKRPEQWEIYDRKWNSLRQKCVGIAFASDCNHYKLNAGNMSSCTQLVPSQLQ